MQRTGMVISQWQFDITPHRAYGLAMGRVAFTLRMGAEDRAALETLSRIERRPVNQLLNKAVKSYLLRRGTKERSLEASLERLRAYRDRDPGFRGARRAFVEAEASLADMVEGTAIEGRPGEGRADRAGPVQSKLRGTLGAKLGRGFRPATPEHGHHS